MFGRDYEDNAAKEDATERLEDISKYVLFVLAGLAVLLLLFYII